MLPFSRIIKYGNEVPKPLPIKKVITHLNSVYVLLTSGQLYARGLNTSGQLGIGSTTNSLTWQFSTDQVQDIWCGQTAALIKKFDGSYMYTGNNTNVGMPNGTSTNTWAVWSVSSTLTSPIKDIAMSNSTISVLLEDNTIRSAGVGQFGQLGDNTTTNNIVGRFVQSIIPNGVIPEKLTASNTMHGFISTAGGLYYTGLVNAINTSGSGQYTVYNFSNAAQANKVLSYINTNTSLAMGIVQTTAGVNRMYFGGARIFGLMADGVDGSLSNVKPFGDFTGTPYPTGTILRAGHGYSYYAQMVVTSTGVFAAGRNIADQAGQLSTGVSSNALYYTQCVLPSGVNPSDVDIIYGFGRTYMTDGNFVYSSGSTVTYGGPVSNVFTLDDPRF